MYTTFTIITAAIVVGVILMLMGMAISNHFSNIRREKEYANRVRKEKYYNSLLPSPIKFTDMRGFIKAEYAFGRFYVQYECINENGDHYSQTISLNSYGGVRENYSRLGCKQGFENETHYKAFQQMKERVKGIIINNGI